MKPLNTSRRAFLRNAGAITTSILLPRRAMASQVTDEGLQELAKLKNLDELNLGGLR